MDGFLPQLKQRQVFKVATIYAVSAWPLIQIADLAVPALGLPDSVMTLLLQIFLFGFPITLIFAWLFNFTSEGIVRADESRNSDSGQQVNLRTTIAITGSLIVALVVTLAVQLVIGGAGISQEFGNSQQASVESAQLSEGKKQAIAILPFVPFSSDPEDEFFADGMVEELLNLLAKIPDLQVAARTSSFAYKGVTNKTIVDIGKELGVDTILEGSIRKNDVTNKIRVTAQLIKVSTGEHLWSETYDREYRDIFQIQDDIASAVVDKMKVTLLGERILPEFIVGTTSVDAMVDYGKGREELSHRTAPSIEKALGHFEQAIAKDNQYARAYIGIADANLLLALYGNLPQEQANNVAQQAIEKALAIDSELGEAYATQGLLLTRSDDQKAEQSFLKAIKLNPSYAMTYMWYGSLMQNRGDVGGARKLFEQAFELDPKSPVAAYNVAWCYYQSGQEAKAMDLFLHIIANDPYYPGAYNLVGDILVKHGRLDESLNMYKRALQVDALNKSAVNGLLIANMDMGNKEDTRQWFTYIEQNPKLFSESEVNYMKARFHASMGEKETALAYFDKVNLDGMHKEKSVYIEGEKTFYRGAYSETVNILASLRNPNKNNDNFFFNFADGQAVLHLAYAYQAIEQFDLANELLVAYETFLFSDNSRLANSAEFYYSMAQVKLLQGDEDAAYEYLQGAVDAGWVQVWRVYYEPTFTEFAKTERFKSIESEINLRLATMRAKVLADRELLIAERGSL